MGQSHEAWQEAEKIEAYVGARNAEKVVEYVNKLHERLTQMEQRLNLAQREIVLLKQEAHKRSVPLIVGPTG